MALQTSGAISLNDIHVEAGGSSGTQASINDADIRGLIGKGSGSQMSFNEWYGASAGLWSNSVDLLLSRTTTGNTDYKGNFTATGYQYNLRVKDWNSLSGAYQDVLGNFSPTDTSVPTSGLNPLGSVSGITYDTLMFQYYQGANLNNDTSSYSNSRGTTLQLYWNNGPGLWPVWQTGTSAPTNWTAINLTFSYGGTNYNWTWTRANHSGVWFGMDFTFGQSQSAGLYTLNLDASGSQVFIGNGTATAQTITGAKFTVT